MSKIKDDAELRSPFVYKDDEALEKPFQMRQMLRLLKYMRYYPKVIVGALVSTLGGVAVALIAPAVIGTTINLATEGKSLHKVLIFASIPLILYIAKFFATRYSIYFTNLLGQKVILTLRKQLFEHVQGLSFDFFDQRPAGSVLVRIMNDVNSLQDLFTNGVINSITNMIQLIGIVVIMFSWNARLAVVSMIIVPIMFILSTKLRKLIRLGWQMVRLRLSRLNAHLAEGIQGMRVTEAYVRQEENQKFFQRMNADYIHQFRIATRRSGMFGPMVDFTGTIGTVLLLGYGVYLLHSGAADITVGLLVAFLNYLGNFWTPISQLGQVYNTLLVAMASSERIFQYLDTEPAVRDSGDATELPPIEGSVEFENVTFRYDASRKALDGVSFRVSPGETVALVGHTGAGKSTVMNLLARFYEPTEGRILIDGVDINHVTLQSLRSQVGIVMQDTFIFSGTIMDNIRYGRPDATDEEVMDAARAVYADAFIRELEDGYHTEVRERGSRLSMGQRQLISFARAILADPQVLILDEATASIDTHTEHFIQLGLQKLLEGRTSFVVAHRLSTIREADQILVFQGGKIVERGNHALLMDSKGYYHGLVEAQFRFLA